MGAQKSGESVNSPQDIVANSIEELFFERKVLFNFLVDLEKESEGIDFYHHDSVVPVNNLFWQLLALNRLVDLARSAAD